MFQSTDGGGMDGVRRSPGGFDFGVQGWQWGEPRPKTITFFMDGTAAVGDQYGRPIRGAAVGEPGQPVREVLFAVGPPQNDDPPGPRTARVNGRDVRLGTHVEVIAALQAEAVDWRRLVGAGWPQLPYAQLLELPRLPPWPFADEHDSTGAPCRCVRCGIRDPKLRRDALRAQREHVEERAKELAQAEAEDEG